MTHSCCQLKIKLNKDFFDLAVEVASQRKLILVGDENIKFHSCNVVAIYLAIVAAFQKTYFNKAVNPLVSFYSLEKIEKAHVFWCFDPSRPVHLKKLC